MLHVKKAYFIIHFYSDKLMCYSNLTIKKSGAIIKI